MLHCSFNKDTDMQRNATCQRDSGETAATPVREALGKEAGDTPSKDSTPKAPPAPLPTLSLPLPQDSRTTPPKPCRAQSVPLLARKQARARRSNSWIFRLVFSLPKEAEGELFYKLALVFTGEQES